MISDKKHTLQLRVDTFSVANLLNSNWGIKKVADVKATSPLQVDGQDANRNPILNFDKSLKETG